jgi:hypothetical protein
MRMSQDKAILLNTVDRQESASPLEKKGYGGCEIPELIKSLH